MWRLAALFVVALISSEPVLSSSGADLGSLHYRSLASTRSCSSGGCDAKSDSAPQGYPFLVSVKDRRNRPVCKGSLVAENVVLTAAHCVDDIKNPRVELGVFGETGSSMEYFRVESKIVHQNYHKERGAVLYDNDIALLVLDGTSRAKTVQVAEATPACFKKDECMQVNLPVIRETGQKYNKFAVQNERVVPHAWNQCWDLLSSKQQEEDSTICLSGIKEKEVSCNGDGAPMLSADWKQTGILNFDSKCTNVKRKTAHTLITPQLKQWIETHLGDISQGILSNEVSHGIVAPANCVLRGGYWLGRWRCRRLPRPKEEDCIFLYGIWVGSSCPDTQVEPRPAPPVEVPRPAPEQGCTFLFGKWIGSNCVNPPPAPARIGCIFLRGRWIGIGC